MNKLLISFNEFLLEKAYNSYDSDLILEGGAAGHMMHPFDDKALTFDDFRKFITAGLQGEMTFDEEPTEKTDGQNVFATVKDGKVMFARNKGQMQNPIDLAGITQMFADHPSELVRDTFTFAAQDLASTLTKLSANDQIKYFNDGKNFMNMELIYSKNPNVINYDRDVIQFHGIKETDGEGNIIGDMGARSAKDIAKLLDAVNAKTGKVFNIIPPQVLKLRKDVDFDDRLPYFMKKIDALQTQYKLAGHDEVSRYHEMWWRDEIEKSFGDLSQDIKEGLLLRWAYDDKKTLNMRQVAKQITPEQMEFLRKYDKVDVKKKYKENIRPFEDLFLEFGSIVLKNASNFVAASPDAEMQRLHNEIRTEAAKIKKGGSVDQIIKVEAELARLDRIGGIESIIPTEGLVFKYNGKIYKLTGTFAAINQLLGIIKYGR
jgi:hypothetical protein